MFNSVLRSSLSEVSLLRGIDGKFHFIILIVFFVVIALGTACKICSATLLKNEQKAFNTTNLIRLHIMANSDNPEDQLLKLAIRNTVLEEVKELIIQADTKREVWQGLSENIYKIETAAKNELDKRGKDYGVTIELGNFAFPERIYGDIQVPEGNYDAMQIILGSGKGRNWWCVLFPPLCFIQVADNGRIKGLNENIPQSETLLRLDFNLDSVRLGKRINISTSDIPRFPGYPVPLTISLSLANFL